MLNLLSVGAAYGVMVAVFQHGWGASLVGTRPSAAIESWLPLFVFVILFGLIDGLPRVRGLPDPRGARARG